MYLVLARKYRPKDFDEVCGQRHITDVLKKAIKEDKVAHAYIFSGPRGTGKTSVARILARSLNCEKGPTVKPCGKCDICRAISAGSCLDVLEIDGASNRGIEEIRSLRENVNLRPAKARFKIYIIDEVHMLTGDACNALLKTLEEPPTYVKFLFATTAPEKIIPTILSRCQRFSFKPFRQEEIETKVKDICEREGFSIEENALKQIYGFSGGSLRDALGILDQLIVNADNGKITYQDVKDFLGLIEDASLNELLIYLKQGDIKATITLFHRLLEEGKDPALILDGLIKRIKDITLHKIGQTDLSLDDESRHMNDLFKNVSIENILNVASMIIEYKERLRRENLPVVLSEILFLRISLLIGSKDAVSPEKKEPQQDKKKEAENIFNPVPAEIKSTGEKIGKDTKEPLESYQSNPAEILGNWKNVLSEIKKSKPTLEAALREGNPLKFEQDTLFIIFGKTYAFHMSIVEKPSNVKFIEKTLSRITGGKKMQVKFILENKPKESLVDDNEVKKIVEFFNGEIVKLEE
jgi:DNA polymerase III subunit gamma/tau